MLAGAERLLSELHFVSHVQVFSSQASHGGPVLQARKIQEQVSQLASVAIPSIPEARIAA